MFSLEALKRRKIVQWALAYLAGAWVVLQLLDVVAEPWGVSAGLLVAAQIILAFGFFATLVLAWYHGEQGRQRVSGPELLMLAALLVIAGAAIAFVRGDGEARPTDADERVLILGQDSIPFRSIAVLPLDNNSPDEEHAYFAGAMTEEITAALSEVPELRVRSRTSAERYRGTDKSAREIARELEVAHVLEGSVQRVGQEARITVQLIDARTDEHLWSETYQQELTDVLEAQVDIAREVADRLAAKFSEREQERILAGSTDDPVAYDLYLRAMESDDEVGLLREAVERDPTFARAWGELGGLYYWERVYTSDPRWTDSLVIALDRAVRLTDDPALELKYQAWKVWSLAEDVEDVRETIGLLREAVEMNPGATDLVRTMAYAYGSIGDLPSAVRWYGRWAELDPFSAGAQAELAWQYMRLGMDEHAERAIRRGAAVDPDAASPWGALQELRLLQGRYAEALAAVDSLRVRGDEAAPLEEGELHLWAGDVEAARRAFERAPDEVVREAPSMMPYLADVHLRRGDTSAARALLSRVREAARPAPTDPWLQYAHLSVPAILDDQPAAVEALRRYVRQGGRNARWIRLEPHFSRVRDDPAFQAELAELERIVEQQRRQVERSLIEER